MLHIGNSALHQGHGELNQPRAVAADPGALLRPQYPAGRPAGGWGRTRHAINGSGREAAAWDGTSPLRRAG